MNTNQNETHAPKNHAPIVQSLVDLGAEWAALGIQFGTQAIERSAKSLELLAKTLQTVSDGLVKKPAERAQTSAEKAAPEVPPAA